jgi:hypothetical protein
VADENGYRNFGSASADIERTGIRALIRSIGILGTCLREAPEFSMSLNRGKGLGVRGK